VNNATLVVDCYLFGPFRWDFSFHAIKTQELSILFIDDFKEGQVSADIFDLE